ncbi:MAG: pirin family protein [Anaerolineales bacterium]|nr:pirin family protein [Anaerolineales bacterium]
MINKVSSGDIFISDNGWREYRLHFSYADYQNSSRDRFGVLVALNDEIIQPGNGFDIHPHHEMEIISYCVEGELTHRDSLGNEVSIGRGDLQYMCAGSGISHAEMNSSLDSQLRFLQIWIQPNESGLSPNYESKKYTKYARRNKLFPVVSGKGRNDVLRINQDAEIYVAEIDQGETLDFANHKDRQSYLVCIEGKIRVDGIRLNTHDAMEISGSVQLDITAENESHLLIVEMAAV